MSDGQQRERLATLAADAGYPGSVLAAVAQATLPAYAAGQLTEEQLGQVANAVQLLAEARLTADQVTAVIAGCRKRTAAQWREPLWAIAFKAASANAHSSRGDANWKPNTFNKGGDRCRSQHPRSPKHRHRRASLGRQQRHPRARRNWPLESPSPYGSPPGATASRFRHLSATSYGLWLVCREAWRRKYICREREAPSGAMFLGSRVDDAVSLYYQRRLAGEQLDPEQIKDAYRELWRHQLDTEREKLGIDWSDIHPDAAFEIGLQALDMTFAQLVPRLGEPIAVQRRVEYTISRRESSGRFSALRPRNPRPRPHRRRDPKSRRLQNQGLDHQPSPGRPRPSSQPVHGRPMATRQPRRRVLLRPDRQAGNMWIST